ncbi:hypothetical protein, partial [Ottowia sp.]|uniref:hypothetical protein n=1 Tax=Ottowia sp. TaxID=1898956 RepID=UPI0039E4B76D
PASHRPADAAALADGLRRWAAATGFGWVAADPAPRSRWRKGPGFGLAGWAAIAARLVVPIPALVGLLMLFGWLVSTVGTGLDAHGLAVPDEPAAAVLLATLALLPVLFVPLGLAFTTRLGTLGLVAVALVGASAAVLQLVYALYIVIAYPHHEYARLMHWAGYTGVGVLGLLAVAAATVLAVLLRVLPVLRAPPFFPLAAVLGVALAVVGVIWVLAQAMLYLLAAPSWVSEPLALAAHPALEVRLAWGLAAVAVVALVIPLVIRFVVKWVPWLARRATWWQRPGPLPVAPAHQIHPSIAACEAGLAARNAVGHMISLTEIRRPYAWHRFWLRFWLRFIHQLGETVFTEGLLGSASGIKFGHWRIIGNGRRLLFCSNFDGFFSGYLDEFILGASEGVNLIWQRTELRPRCAAREGDPAVTAPRRYPPTRLGIYKGCKAEQAFKAYARASMVPHLARYEAYSLSHADIERGTRLREALRGTPSAVKNDQIARALES